MNDKNDKAVVNFRMISNRHFAFATVNFEGKYWIRLALLLFNDFRNGIGGFVNLRCVEHLRLILGDTL